MKKRGSGIGIKLVDHPSGRTFVSRLTLCSAPSAFFPSWVAWISFGVSRCLYSSTYRFKIRFVGHMINQARVQGNGFLVFADCFF
jgi:hypothetical protein